MLGIPLTIGYVATAAPAPADSTSDVVTCHYAAPVVVPSCIAAVLCRKSPLLRG